MRYRRIFERTFRFLLAYGLRYQYERSAHIGFSLLYSNSDISIVINYEYIDDYLSVGLLDKKSKKSVKMPTSVLETRLNMPNNDIVKERIEDIYKRYKSKVMPRNEYVQIVDLYALFVNDNISKILTWREDMD